MQIDFANYVDIEDPHHFKNYPMSSRLPLNSDPRWPLMSFCHYGLVLCVVLFHINGIECSIILFLASLVQQNVFEICLCCIFFSVVHSVLLLGSILIGVYVTVGLSTHLLVEI